MSLTKPLVSIITPVYNGAGYLDPLIRSVQEQAYPALEHIIIDDGSTDDGATQAVLAEHAHLRWWSRENKGQYATMNEGLLEARGDWVCFISADDLMAENAVALVMDFARMRPECEAIYGKTMFICEDGRKHPVQAWFKHVSPAWFVYLMGIYHCSLYVRRSKLLEMKLMFDEQLKYSGDYDWIVRLIRAGLKFGYVNQTLSSLRTHSQRASIVFKDAQERELVSLLERHGINRWLFNLAAFFSYVRSALLETVHFLASGQFSEIAKRIRQRHRCRAVKR